MDGVEPITPGTSVPGAGAVPARIGPAPALHPESSYPVTAPHGTFNLPERMSAGSAKFPEGSTTPGRYFQGSVKLTSVTAGVPEIARLDLMRKVVFAEVM